MSLGLLIVFVVLAVGAGLAVGNAAARQLGTGDEDQSLGKRARKAARRGVVSWLWNRRKKD